MKRRITYISLLSIVCLLYASPLFAQYTVTGHTLQSGLSGNTLYRFGDIMTELLRWSLSLAGIIAFIYLIVGGFKWLSSQGDPKALTSAKQTIFGAVIGLFIVFAAYWIIEIVQTVFGIKILGHNLVPYAYAVVDTGIDFRLRDTQGISTIFSGGPGGKFVTTLIPAALTLAGVAFLGFLIIGAFKFITSGGDQKAIDGAKSTITSALVGLLIVFTSYWIIEIIQTITGIGILP